MKNETCLVLGANGFIGSHLVDQLAAGGFTVKAFDRFRSQGPKFSQSPQVSVIKGDIYDLGTLQRSLEGVDYVFHCFSATTPYSSDNDPVSDIDKNLKPSIDIFEEALKAAVKKVIFVSSGGAVYGHLAEEKPASETDAATPVSPYGINKLAIEGYLAYFKRKHDLGYVIYRLSNPYGPRQVTKNNQGVIPTFINNISTGVGINVVGDGTSSRDYIYIADATKMMAKSFTNAQQGVYNLGSGQQTSLNQIIDVLQGQLDAQPKINYVAEPKTFLKHAAISIERFVSEFGEQQFTTLNDGLAATIAANNQQ